MDRRKPPGPWSDGVREPRRALSAEPDHELANPPAKPPLDCKSLDHRAANQPFPDRPDEVFLPPQEPTPAPTRAKHPRLKNRSFEPARGESLLPPE